MLSPAELARAARFGTDALRQRWMAGRGALRMVLGARSASTRPTSRIVRGVRGRPELADVTARIDFNVSHTRDVALMAIARDLPAERARRCRHRAPRPRGRRRSARAEIPHGAEQATLAELAPRSAAAALPALLDVQGSDEQGDRRRSHRAVSAARRRPRRSAPPSRRAAALLTARLVAALRRGAGGVARDSRALARGGRERSRERSATGAHAARSAPQLPLRAPAAAFRLGVLRLRILPSLLQPEPIRGTFPDRRLELPREASP